MASGHGQTGNGGPAARPLSSPHSREAEGKAREVVALNQLTGAFDLVAGL